MEAILQRGEKLDDLVEKSEGLSMQSKAFYKTVSYTCSLNYITLRHCKDTLQLGYVRTVTHNDKSGVQETAACSLPIDQAFLPSRTDTLTSTDSLILFKQSDLLQMFFPIKHSSWY